MGLGISMLASSMPTRLHPAAPGATTTRRGPMQALRSELEAAGFPAVSPLRLIGGCLGAGFTVFILVLAISASPVIAAAFAIPAAWLPRAVLRSRARARAERLRLLWPDAVDHLASAVRAGMSLPEALAALGDRGPEDLRPAFARFAATHAASGRFGPSLDQLRDDLADPVGDRVVEALRVAREVGGGELGRLLRTLSEFLRADARMRAELAARQSWTVNAARLSVAAPWLVLGLLSLQPETVAAYNSAGGAVVLAAGGAVTVLAYRLMLAFGRLPEDPRISRERVSADSASALPGAR